MELEAWILSAVLVIIISVLKIVDYLVTKKSNKEVIDKLDEIKESMASTSTTVEKLWDIHDHYDDDGSPLWYVPRSWATVQKEIVKTQQQISLTLNTAARTLERIEETIRKGYKGK